MMQCFNGADRTAAMKNVLSPISVTRITMSDFSVALKKSVPPTMASSDNKTFAWSTDTSVAMISSNFRLKIAALDLTRAESVVWR